MVFALTLWSPACLGVVPDYVACCSAPSVDGVGYRVVGTTGCGLRVIFMVAVIESRGLVVVVSCDSGAVVGRALGLLMLVGI